MSKNQVNLQDNFLNQVRKESNPVTIYLISGVQLKGLVRGFDSFTVVLESLGKPPQIVYKHAIASVVPSKPVSGILTREERPGEQPPERPAERPAEQHAEQPAEEPVAAPQPAQESAAAPLPAEEPAAAPQPAQPVEPAREEEKEQE